MKTEFEATFTNIVKSDVRKRLRQARAMLIYKEHLMKRVVFSFPAGHKLKGGWLRVRQEKDKITMSIKIINGQRIKDQKELCLTVDNFAAAQEFLKLVGCPQKSYQETKRELWRLNGVEITIDHWPFLEPLIEVEGRSEASVKKACEKLGFDYSQAVFCSADVLYENKYHWPIKKIVHIPRLTFKMKNPFKN
jgi:adenylate cyclase, class 2